jgi:hypothetical protein
MGVISGTGIKQGDLVDFMSAVMTLVNEMRTDHAATNTALSDTISLLFALNSRVKSIISIVSNITSNQGSLTISALLNTGLASYATAAPATLTAAAVSFTI